MYNMKDKIKKYYAPLDVANLSIWLAKGILTPASFNENWKQDFQSKINEGCLLLLKNNHSLNNANCTVEIELIEGLDEVHDCGAYYVYIGCIPQSRIQKIYFKTEELRETAVSNITGGNAYFDNSLIGSHKLTDIVIELSEKGQKFNNKSKAGSIDKFNQYMGGFCILRLLTLGNSIGYDLLIKQIDSFCKGTSLELSQYQNDKIDAQSYVTKAGSLINGSSLQDWLQNNGSPFKLKISGIPEFDKLDNENLIYAIIGIYGTTKGAKRNVDVFIRDCTTGQFADKKAILPIVGLIFGLKEKYFNARSFYRIDDKEIKYKFDISIPFDRFMLECIYQYCFDKNYDYANLLLESNPPQYKSDEVLLFGEKLGVKKKETPEQATEQNAKEVCGNEFSTISTNYLANHKELLLQLNDLQNKQQKVIEQLQDNYGLMQKEFSKYVAALNANDLELEKTNADLKQKGSELEQAKVELNAKDSELINVKKDIEEKNTQNKQLVAENSDLREKNKVLEEQLTIISSESDSLAEDPIILNSGNPAGDDSEEITSPISNSEAPNSELSNQDPLTGGLENKEKEGDSDKTDCSTMNNGPIKSDLSAEEPTNLISGKSAHEDSNRIYPQISNSEVPNSELSNLYTITGGLVDEEESLSKIVCSKMNNDHTNSELFPKDPTNLSSGKITDEDSSRSTNKKKTKKPQKKSDTKSKTTSKSR